MNLLIIKNLTKLYKQYRLSNDPKISQFKSNVINKLIKIVKEYNKEIKNGNELKGIKGVGEGSIRRINEIIKTSTLLELKDDNNSDIISNLSNVYGIGKVKAKSLVVDNRIRSITDLRDKIESGNVSVTRNVILGLKYFEDINKKIMRKEMDAFQKYIGECIRNNSIFHGVVFSICGSYRRGLTSSGDIDVLISDPEYKTGIQKQEYLSKLVNFLIDKKFILDSLTSNGLTKYMGICRLPRRKIARRIDIRCVNYNSYYTALLYFTGSRQLNINMRLNALNNGYKLNEYSVYNIKKKQEIFPKSEEEIFKLCQMDYLQPRDRNL